ncbi:MAG: hypothetical protein PHN88_09220 [Ignavibacteria bacterium]|nr:hypothetical protein [Ignavibacteria bacterium]
MAIKNYVDGWQNPKFIIRDSEGNEIEVIELMLTGAEGLVRDMIPNILIHPLASGDIVAVPKGFHYTFTLSYQEYSPADNTLKIGRIWDYWQDGHEIILFPRKEILSKYYSVYFLDGFSMGIMKGGENAPGNRLITLKLGTKKLQNKLEMVDPNNINFTKYGFAYL